MWERVADAVILGAFGAWLGASVLCQFPGERTRWVRRWDLFGIIPEWKFFAPKPGVSDYHLLYRDLRADGTMTNWREILFGEKRRWWNMLWNPNRRQRKALCDLLIEFLQYWRSASAGVIQTSVPYLHLLNYVSRQPRVDEACTGTQFLLLESFGCLSRESPKVLCLSGVHRLT